MGQEENPVRSGHSAEDMKKELARKWGLDRSRFGLKEGDLKKYNGEPKKKPSR